MQKDCDTKEPAMIRSMFDRIAQTYDRTNWWMSSGLHVLWNKKLIRELMRRAPERKKTIRFLDLCCGTGEILFRYSASFSAIHPEKSVEITGVDFSPSMLEIAQARALKCEKNRGMQFILSDATSLPFANAQYDQLSIAYGVRNVADRKKLFSEVARVVAPNGTVAFLELTAPRAGWLKKIHGWYLSRAIPWIGKKVSGNWAPYEYLSSSIQTFPEPEILVREMRAAGIDEIEKISLMFGSATLFIGRVR